MNHLHKYIWKLWVTEISPQGIRNYIMVKLQVIINVRDKIRFGERHVHIENASILFAPLLIWRAVGGSNTKLKSWRGRISMAWTVNAMCYEMCPFFLYHKDLEIIHSHEHLSIRTSDQCFIYLGTWTVFTPNLYNDSLLKIIRICCSVLKFSLSCFYGNCNTDKTQ